MLASDSQRPCCLTSTDGSCATATGAKRSSKAVEPAAALSLGRDPEKAAATETALALMAALAGQSGGSGGQAAAAAAAFHDAGAVAVLERATKAATALLGASAADGQWVTCAGVLLDEGAVAESRWVSLQWIRPANRQTPSNRCRSLIHLCSRGLMPLSSRHISRPRSATLTVQCYSYNFRAL